MTEVKMDRELSWDDEIVQDSEFVTLIPGEYPFTVKGFERARTNGSDKLPPTAMAIVDIEINGQATVKDRLVLHSKMEWKLSEFFVSLGMKKKGEPLKMNWGAIIGKTGRCKVINEEYKGNTYNRIDKYLEPEQAPVQNGTPAFNPATF